MGLTVLEGESLAIKTWRMAAGKSDTGAMAVSLYLETATWHGEGKH